MLRKLVSGGLAVVMLVGAVWWSSARENAARVEVAVLSPENWQNWAPAGKEVDAIAGDIVLRNQYLTAVIAQPLESRNANMTVKQVAGALIDFTTRESNNDQLSAFYPGARQYPFRSWTLTDDQGQALSVESGAHETKGAEVAVTAAGAADRPAVTVRYRLAPQDHYLTVITEFSNPGDKPLQVPLIDDLRLDSNYEWFDKSPNGVDPVFWAYDRYWQQAYGILQPEREIEMTTTGNTSVVRYQQADRATTVSLAPGKQLTLTRKLFAGRNLLDVRSEMAAEQQQPLEEMHLFVIAGGQPLENADVRFRKGDTDWGGGRTNDIGKLLGRLPAGRYDITISWLEIPLRKDHTLEVRPGRNVYNVMIPEVTPGKVVARITDEQGQPLPVKVAFLTKNGQPPLQFGPVSADFGVKNLRYAPLGQFEQKVPPGEYDVVISRGPEYDAVFQTLKVKLGEVVQLRAQLKRSVDTTGWVSSDLHSHSTPSGDNTSSQRGRVLNHVCEHLEFVPCTEHNRIDTYGPVIRELEVAKFIATIPGIELTGSPLPLNHQNAFPMVLRPYRQDGGAPLPDADPGVQIERLATWDNRSEKVVQVNHPDLGWMFYDRDGDEKPDGGYERMFPHIRVVEVHPIDTILEQGPLTQRQGYEFPNTSFAWLQLLNQGLRIPGVVNSDAHNNYHGTGWLRNWIKSSSDDPTQVQTDELIRHINQGQTVLSNGPFLEMSLQAGDKTVGPGQDLKTQDGNGRLHVRVQTPNWFDVDRVFVLVNGRIAEGLDFRRATAGGYFHDEGPVRFEATLDLRLKQDAHVIVVAAGEKFNLSRIYGSDWGTVPPVAFNNPIFVDLGGDGFMPNKDTLGHPLPVKKPSRKL